MLFSSNKKLIAVVVCSSLLSSCETKPERYDGICDLMDNKISWYKAAKKVEKKRGIEISTIFAFIKQESSFNPYAKPPIKKVFFDLIPVGRDSSSYGFSQAKDGTWDWYQERENISGASRSDFYDSSDFIAWYILQSKKMANISTTDVYNQYLAYHEGQVGFKAGSFNAKPWLKQVAKKVENTAKIYKKELQTCGEKLDNTYSWSYF